MHMVRFRLPEMTLHAAAARAGVATADPRHAAGAWLAEAFGPRAPASWRLDAHQGYVLLGYAGGSDGFRADGVEISAKAMPETIPAGVALRFATRICPVVRRGRQDIDAWKSPGAAAEHGSRAAAYRAWLAPRLEGAALIDAALERFDIVEITERGQTFRKPSAELHGILRVQDPGAFMATLGRGIGRHARFGFGMLLVAPQA